MRNEIEFRRDCEESLARVGEETLKKVQFRFFDGEKEENNPYLALDAIYDEHIYNDDDEWLAEQEIRIHIYSDDREGSEEDYRETIEYALKARVRPLALKAWCYEVEMDIMNDREAREEEKSA